MSAIAKSPEELLEDAMARYHYSGDALIEILHTAQELYGCLSVPVLGKVARKLQLPPSRVFGVATFYHLFRFVPAPRHCASICVGTACYVAGSTELARILKENGWHPEIDRCSGACGLAPLMVCDGIDLPRATPAKLKDRLRLVS